MTANHNKALETIRSEALEAWKQAATPPAREQVHFAYLGRKGKVAELMKLIPSLPTEEKVAFGSAVNALKQELTQVLTEKKVIERLVDMSVPAEQLSAGTIHPISAIMEEMEDIFRELSFEVVEGPEIVTDEENFESLNLGIHHPARDGHDSFFLKDDLLLRTQTTAIQVGEMKKRFAKGDLPIRIVMPGKTYRRESDQTHSAMFHQIDAVMVDTQTTFADLKGILDYFVKRLFGDNVETRFRPHHFPFTEPSAELDIRWKGASGTQGKHAGWLEMGGCGMIHPDVLRRAGINPKIYQGWAFGMSLERPLMVRHHIPDLRLLFSNSAQFLDQFPKP
ncbi:MAG TPA: phenylalanine--tRNA ligase subunit alpha [Verrucomicrobiae bacterium]|nr:phenylalanine--tRNA ligase subunit alpha [Verrucomicrobiae bacterium]